MSLIDNTTAQWTANTPFGNNNHYLNNNFSTAGNPLAGAIDGGPVEYNASNGTVVNSYSNGADGAKSALEFGSYIFFAGDNTQGIRRIDNDWASNLTTYQATVEQTESITTDGTSIYGNDDVTRDQIIKWSVTNNPTSFSLTQQWAEDVATGGRFRGISYFDHGSGDDYIYASDGGNTTGDNIFAFDADTGAATAVSFNGTAITVPGTDLVYQAIIHEVGGRKLLMAATTSELHVWDMLSPTTTISATPTETYTIAAGTNQLFNNIGGALGGQFLGASARGSQLFLGNGSQVLAYELAATPLSTEVTNTNDSGEGSLRQALIHAAANPGADTITFTGTTFTNATPDTITLASELTYFSNAGNDVTIQAPGNASLTVSGNNASRVFNFNSASEITIDGLAIADGSVMGRGGGIFNESTGTVNITNSTLSSNSTIGAGDGGGISNNSTGTVNITNSTLSSNSISGSGDGGGISNNFTGTVNITNSTLSSNSTTVGNAGGINNNSTGTVNITNSTLSSNSTSGGGFGGGISNNSTGTVNITNSTLSSNSTSGGSFGGGISNNSTGTVNVTNTIIAGNTGPSNPDVFGTFISNNRNVIGDTTGSNGFGGTDITGVAANTVINTTLANNGGPTLTHALVAGSPALDAGNNADVPGTITTDQRGTGFDRISNGTVDIGAYETQVSPLVISEIMYNPASAEDNWEWIEVYNSGSSAVDLSGYVLDDINGTAHGSANIASGSIAAGSSAILFNSDDVSTSDFEAAWGTGITLIGVTSWGNMALNNGGDTVSLWDSFASYSGDHTTHTNAIETVAYDDTAPWPVDNNSASIYLTDLTADNTDGSNWALSTTGGSTPLGTGYLSANAGGNSGSDIGSPGGTLSAVTLSSGTITAANVAQGTTNHPLYQLDLAVATANAQLTGATFTTGGIYAAADIVANSFELFYSTDTTFDAGDTSLGTQAVVTSGNTLAFTGLSQTINNGSTGTLFLVADIASGATAGNTINIAAPNLSDITFTSASKTGTLSASGDQAFDALPTITSITSTTTDGTFGVGGTVNVTVNFSENVTLAGGNLTLNLDSGGTVTLTPFSSNSVSGTYTVGTGQNSTDLNTTGLTLAGGASLQDATSNNVTLTIPGGQSLADNKALVIDTTAPTVTVEQAVGQGDPTTSSPINYTVTFSEAVTGFATGDVTLGGTAGATTGTVTGSGTTYTVAVSGMTANGTAIATLAAGVATDTAGNPNTASTSTDNIVTFNGINSAPVVDLNGGASGIDYSATFISGGGEVAIVDSTNLTVTDDGANLTNATVTITNLLDFGNEVLSFDTSGTSLTGSYDTATGVLFLSGSDTVANYQQVLRTVQYNNTAASPNTTARTIEFVANDGSLNSTTATTTLNIALSPTVQFSAASYTSPENVGTSSAITLTRTGNTTSTSTVQVSLTGGTATGGGTDYTSSSFPLTVTFNPGETSKTVDILVNDDSIDEPGADETVTFSVASLTNATIGSQNTTTLNITDNDNTPNLSINDVSVNEHAGTATFTVSLDAASSQNITVDYASSDGTAIAGSDYTSASGSLTFAAGETSKAITVNLTDDSLDESNETFSVDLSNATNASISDAQGVGTITDNDGQPNLSISDVTVNENAGTATFTVSLDAASAQTITVDYASSDGTAIAGNDYTSASGSLTFAAGETSKNITVNISDDSLDESNETFTVDLSNTTNATIADAQGVGTITDNDVAVVPSPSPSPVPSSPNPQVPVSPPSNSPVSLSCPFLSSPPVFPALNMIGITREGTSFNDILLGNNQSETFWAREGEDWVIALQGDDNIYGESGDDWLSANQGTDWVDGGLGNDWIHGGQGNDGVRGGEGNDVIFGERGNDIVEGNDGNDFLSGNMGNDFLDGGLGDDVVHAGQDNDRLAGGEGHDTLFGDLGDDCIHGNLGNDWLLGNQGDDNLRGQEGNDSLWGGQGNDILLGGVGDDVLFGDRGNDLFVLAIGEGGDRIMDFSAGDRLGLSTGLTYTQLTLAQNGDNTIISSNNQVLAILEKVTVNTLNENRFVNIV